MFAYYQLFVYNSTWYFPTIKIYLISLSYRNRSLYNQLLQSNGNGELSTIVASHVSLSTISIFKYLLLFYHPVWWPPTAKIDSMWPKAWMCRWFMGGSLTLMTRDHVRSIVTLSIDNCTVRNTTIRKILSKDKLHIPFICDILYFTAEIFRQNFVRYGWCQNINTMMLL